MPKFNDMHSKTPIPVKHVVLIHYGNPDFTSALAVLSHCRVYHDWRIKVVTDETDNWLDFMGRTKYVNYDIEDAILLETEYAHQVNIPLNIYSVRSDILRVYYLFKYGGLYVDTDTIAYQQLSNERITQAANEDAIIVGEEVYNPENDDYRFVTLVNANIYAPYPNTTAMRYWMEGFIPEYSFYQGQLCEDKPYKIGEINLNHKTRLFDYSLYYLNLLATLMPIKIITLDFTSFYRIKDVFVYVNLKNTVNDFENVLSFHLWRSAWKPMGIIDNLDIKWIKEHQETLLFKLSEPYINDLERLNK